MIDLKLHNYSAWAEAFSIFAKYNPDGWGDVEAEHDVIFAGPHPDLVSAEDKVRLEELGWHVGIESDEMFYHFT